MFNTADIKWVTQLQRYDAYLAVMASVGEHRFGVRLPYVKADHEKQEELMKKELITLLREKGLIS